MTTADNKGFTFIEIMVVIALLGFLGLVFIPKLMDLRPDAKVAVLDGLRGSVRSAAQQVHSKALLAGLAEQRNATLNINGQLVRLRYGYPRTNQMFYRNSSNPGLVEVSITGANISGNIVRLDNDNNCRIRYRQPTGSGQQPRIDTRNCGVA